MLFTIAAIAFIHCALYKKAHVVGLIYWLAASTMNTNLEAVQAVTMLLLMVEVMLWITP